MAVLLETSKGDLVIDLFTDECPLATRNFLKLCKYGLRLADELRGAIQRCQVQLHELPRADEVPCRRRIKYYNNVLFHNVQTNFIAQTGDPTGTGKGGKSIYGCATCAKLACCRSRYMPPEAD